MKIKKINNESLKMEYNKKETMTVMKTKPK